MLRKKIFIETTIKQNYKQLLIQGPFVFNFCTPKYFPNYLLKVPFKNIHLCIETIFLETTVQLNYRQLLIQGPFVLNFSNSYKLLVYLSVEHVESAI